MFLREDAGGDRDGAVGRYVAQVDPEVAADIVVDLHDPAWPVVRRVSSAPRAPPPCPAGPGRRRRLPLPGGGVDGAFAAGLLPHVPDPGRVLADLGRVVRPGGQLALFHPSGRAALAARQGRVPRDDDLLAPGPLDRLLRANGWSLASYDGGPGRFLALAERLRWEPSRPTGTGPCPGAEMEADTIETERLVLTPLRVSDAEQMAEVLADPRLHLFIGDRPATLDELRARYAAMTAGSSSPDEVWRNWVVRGRADLLPVGTVQATLHRRDERRSAEIAWVVGIPYQGKGYAAEAARALVVWLADHDIREVAAHIRPDHAASGRVARRAGLHPTADLVDGEVVWRTPGQG